MANPPWSETPDSQRGRFARDSKGETSRRPELQAEEPAYESRRRTQESLRIYVGCLSCSLSRPRSGLEARHVEFEVLFLGSMATRRPWGEPTVLCND